MSEHCHHTRRRDDERQPTGWATYSGGAHEALIRDLDSGQPMGPNYMGELMWPVEVVYDPETDSTRVGFSLLAPTTEAAS